MSKTQRSCSLLRRVWTLLHNLWNYVDLWELCITLLKTTLILAKTTLQPAVSCSPGDFSAFWCIHFIGGGLYSTWWTRSKVARPPKSPSVHCLISKIEITLWSLLFLCPSPAASCTSFLHFSSWGHPAGNDRGPYPEIQGPPQPHRFKLKFVSTESKFGLFS